MFLFRITGISQIFLEHLPCIVQYSRWGNEMSKVPFPFSTSPQTSGTPGDGGTEGGTWARGKSPKTSRKGGQRRAVSRLGDGAQGLGAQVKMKKAERSSEAEESKGGKPRIYCYLSTLSLYKSRCREATCTADLHVKSIANHALTHCSGPHLSTHLATAAGRLSRPS